MSKKLHILFLCGWFPSKVLPTNGDFIQRHAEAIATKHKVSVLHIISSDEINSNYIDFKQKNNLDIYIGYIKPSKNKLLKMKRFWTIFNQITKKIDSFDVVHLNEIYPFGIFALHLKKKFNKPYLISEHYTGYLQSQQNTVSFFEKFISKKITNNATYVCPVSNNLAKSMQNFGLKGNYEIVPNVVDTNLFIPKTSKNNVFTLIHVSGMHDAQKNISGMLRVAKKLEEKIGEFTWNFIGGNATEFSKLIQKLQFKKAKINFINHLSQEKLTSYLQQANLCISFSNYETFGIVMTESISCGTPVISTNTGVLSELSKEDFFEIIPIKNEIELLEKIIKFHQQDENFDTKKMHKLISEKFSISIIANKFSRLYTKILNQ